MKIIQIVSNKHWTGAADPAVTLSSDLQKKGHEVLFVCREGWSLETEAGKRKLNINTSLDLGGSRSPLSLLSDFFKLKKIINDFKADLLHLHLSHDHLLGALAARYCGRKVAVVRTHHKINKIRSDPFHRFLFNRLTDLNVLLSEKYRQQTASFLKHQLVVQGGVDLSLFRPSVSGRKARLKYGLGKNTILVGLISHMRATRRQELALAAFKQIYSGFPDARLVFLGDSDQKYKKHLINLVARQQLESKVIFIVDKEDDWPEMLAVIDIAMYLAIGSEGSARAVMESMALGKPVIAARVGVVPEIVSHNHSGIIIPQGDRTALSDAMTTLLHYPEKRESMGKKGREIIEETFRSEFRAEKLEQAYYDIVARKSPVAD